MRKKSVFFSFESFFEKFRKVSEQKKSGTLKSKRRGAAARTEKKKKRKEKKIKKGKKRKEKCRFGKRTSRGARS